MEADPAGSWLVVRRGAVHVVLNPGDAPATVPVPGPGEVLAAWEPAELSAGTVTLPGRSVAVVRAPRGSLAGHGSTPAAAHTDPAT